MHERVSSVAMPLEGEYSWQILRGKDGTHATTWALKAAQVPILHFPAPHDSTWLGCFPPVQYHPTRLSQRQEQQC